MLLAAGQKKVPKTYAVAVSPMRPNLAAVGANSGMAFLTFDRMYPLPVAALPPRDLAAAHVSPSREGDPQPVHVSYVAQFGDTLWHVSCAAAEKVRTRGARPGRPVERILVVSDVHADPLP
jgi:hypothetical protein